MDMFRKFTACELSSNISSVESSFDQSSSASALAASHAASARSSHKRRHHDIHRVFQLSRHKNLGMLPITHLQNALEVSDGDDDDNDDGDGESLIMQVSQVLSVVHQVRKFCF